MTTVKISKRSIFKRRRDGQVSQGGGGSSVTRSVASSPGSEFNPVILQDYAKKVGGNLFKGTQNIEGDLNVLGNINQTGQAYITYAEKVDVKSNLMQLNKGEVSSQITSVIPGTTTAFSGLEINRGSGEAYYLGVVEGANPLIKLGKKNSLVTLAAREDSPMNNGVMLWDAANHRMKAVAAAPDSDKLGNIVAADYWNKYNSNIPSHDWTMANAIVYGDYTTASFAPGIVGGVGAKIDQTGHGEMKSLDLREFLRTPELIKNKVSVANNQFWFTDPGLIQNVSGTGPYTLTLKIKEGDGISFRVGDILIGIFNHDTGFQTCYLDVVSLDFGNNQIVVNSRNGVAPRKFMQLARKGNKTNADRQTSVFVDGLEGYMRVLGDVDSHTTDFNNIVAQMGYLNLTSPVFGLMERGVYVKDYGYFENVRVSGEIIVTGGNAETLIGAQSKADSAQAAATSVANTAQNTANTANALAASKTDAWVTRITQDTVTSQYMRTLGLVVGDHIQMGSEAVISWDKVTGGQAAIDAVQVGGRNLYRSSHDPTIFVFSWSSGITVIPENDVHEGSVYHFTNTSENWCALKKSLLADIENETTITISVLVKSSVGGNLTFYYGPGNGYEALTPVNNTGKWHQVSLTFVKKEGVSNPHLGLSGISDIYISRIKIEKGNKATDWTPAPEDVDAGINTAVSDAATAQSTANSAKSTAESKTDAWATQITKDTVTAEFLRARNLVVGDHIQMGPEAVISWDKVTGGQAAIDAVQVGGRNLYRSSHDPTIFVFSWSSGITVIPENDVHEGSVYHFTNTSENWCALKKSLLADIENETTITISVLVKSSVGGNLTFYYGPGNGYEALTPVNNTGKWHQVSLTFVKKEGVSNPHLGLSGISDIYISRIKIEKGNKATDWTPAPEDVDASIATKVTADQATQITKDTITTTNIIAQNLQVQAANIAGQLTAAQIDVDSLTVRNLQTSPSGQRLIISSDRNSLSFYENTIENIKIDAGISEGLPGIRMKDAIIHLTRSSGSGFAQMSGSSVVSTHVHAKLLSFEVLTINNSTKIQVHPYNGASLVNAYSSSRYGTRVGNVLIKVKKGLIYDMEYDD